MNEIPVRKISHVIPISHELLHPSEPVAVPRRRRLRWAIRNHWWRMRRAVGYRIAGDSGGWDE